MRPITQIAHVRELCRLERMGNFGAGEIEFHCIHWVIPMSALIHREILR